jgi:SAM-dependent methyltransferase
MDIERLETALTSLNNGRAPTPPSHLIFVGDGPYSEIAGEFLSYFVRVGELPVDGTVLDIGSGIGRMASGLSLYLNENGRYVGFEPVETGVRWCSQAYSHISNFEFHWVDLFNELYNPAGRVNATEYRFPMEDEAADLVIATSIFTHLYEDDIAAYCREIRRVLRPEGKLLATVYVFDGEHPPESDRDLVRFDQVDPANANRRHIADAPPLAAVCYKSDYLSALMETNLGRSVSIQKGRWQNGPGPWYQDLVIS